MRVQKQEGERQHPQIFTLTSSTARFSTICDRTCCPRSSHSELYQVSTSNLSRLTQKERKESDKGKMTTDQKECINEIKILFKYLRTNRRSLAKNE